MGKLKRALLRFIDSYWLPGAFVLGFIGLFELFQMEFVPTEDDRALYALGLSILALVVFLNAVVNLFRKKWKQAFVQVLVLPLCAYVVLVQGLAVFLDAMSKPDEFAKI